MNTAIHEAEVIEPSNAVAVRDPNTPAPEPKAMTPAQAKIDAVAAITMKAYDRASMLNLTDQEIQALQAEFPDDAFLPGAAGKENLLYLQHACLRDRLNQVFRPGQWSIIPRNRWAEPFKTQKGIEASRVYVEAMLIVRGCFVAEAVGEMEYYPNNAIQNYGDAVEGAKTAALRRCCKEFGIGLQAWRKDWCDGWWKRKNAPKAPVFKSPPAQTPSPSNASHVPTPQNAPQVKSERLQANPVTAATPEQKAKMIATIESEGPDAVQRALRYFIEAGALLPNEILQDLPIHWIPYTQAQFRELGLLIAKMSETDKAERPAWVRLQPKSDTGIPVSQSNPATSFNPEEEENPFNEPERAREAPKAQQPELTANDETWRSYLTPWGKNAGVRLDKLPKNTLWGFWKNHTVETEYKGKPIAPEKIAKAQEFRDMLDASGRHYAFTEQ